MAPRTPRSTTSVLLLAAGVFLASCSSGSESDIADAPASPPSTSAATATSTMPATTVPATTVPASTVPATTVPASTAVAVQSDLDDAFLADALDGASVPAGALLFAVIDPGGATSEAAVGTDQAGVGPTANDTFRVGSITKVFTSIAVLTLVDEGLVDLDAAAADYVSRIAVPAGVTVRDLLSHRSGIFNVTDDPAFFPRVMDVPDRIWTPEDQMEMIADRDQLFEPGSQFRYSNTNYLVLGVLVEEVTGQRYDQVVRSRIIDPLEMSATYLDGFEDGPEPFDPWQGPSPTGDEPFEYTSIATAAWAAGGMVSSAPDLHRLFSALYAGQIISAESLAEMTVGDDYGLGVELSDWPDGLIGHSGGIPGYGALVRYSVDADTAAFFASTSPGANPDEGIVQVIEALAAAG